MKQHSLSANRLLALWDSLGMMVVFLVLFIACSLAVPNFFGSDNMENLALQVCWIGIVACSMLFCLASGDFDLSIGSVYACSGVVTALTLKSSNNVALALCAGLGTGLAVGLLNGVVIAVFKINALITTLATMQIVRGIGQVISKGQSINVSHEGFFFLGQGRFLDLGEQFRGVPMPVCFTFLCFIAFGVLLHLTTYGRNTLAIGGNSEAARLAGIAVKRTKIMIFAVQGAMAAFVGVLATSQMELCHPTTTGQGFELKVISACVLGGVSLTGGIGSIFCVIAGVLIMGTVENAMTLRSIDPFYQNIVNGCILLGAVLLDRLKVWLRGRS